MSRTNPKALLIAVSEAICLKPFIIVGISYRRDNIAYIFQGISAAVGNGNSKSGGYSKGFGATVNALRRPMLFNNPMKTMFTSKLEPP